MRRRRIKTLKARGRGVGKCVHRIHVDDRQNDAKRAFVRTKVSPRGWKEEEEKEAS